MNDYALGNHFMSLREKAGLNNVELRDNYDAVIHMVTAAKGAEKYYTTENNKARTESIPESASVVKTAHMYTTKQEKYLLEEQSVWSWSSG